MTTPLWVLLGFAAWTLLTLLVGVGAVRWHLILTGRKQLNEFPADTPHGSPCYRRAMRAHANCVENLPVYGAIAVTATLAGVQGATLDTLALVFLLGRVLQTLTHVGLAETSTAVGIRFAFFFTQLVCMGWMAAAVAMRAA